MHIFCFLLSVGDASSPHGANCIQFNGGDGSKSSPNSPAGAGNEGLTRQQLDLISQIMQQTKQANAGLTSVGGQKPVQRPRTWNMQVNQIAIARRDRYFRHTIYITFYVYVIVVVTVAHTSYHIRY